jgi:hypothetical protein
MKLPQDLENDWIRFVETKPSVAALADWCSIKAAEYGLDFFDLSGTLIARVLKPELPEPTPAPTPKEN